MAVGDLVRSLGTGLVWASSGGDYTMDISEGGAGLATTDARSGAKGDLGTPRAGIHAVEVLIKNATAPTAGGTFDIYWCESSSATAANNNAGPDGVWTGSDQTFTAPDSNELGSLTFLGSIPVTATASEIYQKFFEFEPIMQYGFPVVVNSTDQSTSTTGADHSITVYPVTYNSVQA